MYIFGKLVITQHGYPVEALLGLSRSLSARLGGATPLVSRIGSCGSRISCVLLDNDSAMVGAGWVDCLGGGRAGVRYAGTCAGSTRCRDINVFFKLL